MNVKYHASDLARQVIISNGLAEGDQVEVRALAKRLNLSKPVEISERPIISDGALRQVDDRYQIDVKKTVSANRKRFTIAHELGHILLMETSSGDEGRSIDDEIIDDGKIEFFCNEFASALLVPDELIQEFQSWNEITLDRLAARSDILRVGIEPLLKRVVQEAPGKGGYMVFDEESEEGVPEGFVLVSGAFPTKYNAGRKKPNQGFQISKESALYTYFHKVLNSGREYLFTDVSLNLTPFPGMQPTLTSMMARVFGSRIYTVVVPDSVPAEILSHENRIKIGEREREDLGKFL